MKTHRYLKPAIVAAALAIALPAAAQGFRDDDGDNSDSGPDQGDPSDGAPVA